MINTLISFFLKHRFVTVLILLTVLLWGMAVAPFNWRIGGTLSNPLAVDAIPNIGENQQIIYTEWQGRSPQDIEDQITYPLTTSLLGISGVKSIRSTSYFGGSSIYIIFDEDIDYYWSRTRILEKLNALPKGTLPEKVSPSLGPDATSLGQIYWYTLEGRDNKGEPNGGWDPQELRTIQDFYVRYGLASTKGVAEVASIGGYLKEYQIDINPNAMKAYNVNSIDIIKAVQNSNLDIGARTIEYNKAEYFIRALGYIKSLEDLEYTVVKTVNNIPIRLKDVTHISFGPSSRRGGLDKNGTEAVGGVVVARYGANPMEVIKNLKEKIKEIETGLPKKTLSDGSVSKINIIPFYDRSRLIKETVNTLEEALTLEILVSLLVVIILVLNFRASLLISSVLPIGVLITFIAMKMIDIDANIVSLSGIVIAIGVMVDVSIIFIENMVKHLKTNNSKNNLEKIKTATIEVAPAVVTSIATTIISFIPIFSMEAAEGKLFKPLAITKTLAMLAALFIGLVFIPSLSYLFFFVKNKRLKLPIVNKKIVNVINVLLVLFIVISLSQKWEPLGAERHPFLNFIFVLLILGTILTILMTVIKYYETILSWCLNHKKTFLAIPLCIIFFGILIWQGIDTIFGFSPKFVKQSTPYQFASNLFPGIGREFMPSLDEGSFLLMPTTMPHSGVEENLDVIKLLDKRLNAIPEVDVVLGKWGRVNSALDPAPISMFENIINYKSEYALDSLDNRQRFKTNENDAFILKDGATYNLKTDDFREINPMKDLIVDNSGKYFRQWRKHIKSPNDIWNEIIKQANIPGLTSSPKLQPIETRLIMLQTGLRSPMGIKVFGPDLQTLEHFGLELEKALKDVKGVYPSSVFADRTVGKPYLEIKIDRKAISRYGIDINTLQKVLQSSIGGVPLTTTVEGRERYPVRVRYAREFRDNPEALKNILIPTSDNSMIPLQELASIDFKKGPQVIKSEDTFLVSYVVFDKIEGMSEIDVVENSKEHISNLIEKGILNVPKNVTFRFTGNYENQVRATERLTIVVPIVLLIILLILYFQFGSFKISAMIFSGVFVAFSGGFIMLWLYGQDWFLNISFLGTNIRDVFQIAPINLSVAVWVGFVALFGIATEDGVLMGTYLTQLFETKQPKTKQELRAIVLEAGKKRVRPAMMTTATTLIALLPVLTSSGKGSNIMIPMAIPSFGGMFVAIVTIFIVPTLYTIWKEKQLKLS